MKLGRYEGVGDSLKISLEADDIDAIAQRIIEMLKPIIIGNDKQDTGDVIFTIESLAEYLQVDTGWVYKKVSLKEIPHFHVGRYPRFRKAQIDRWIETQTIKPIPPFKKENYRMIS